ITPAQTKNRVNKQRTSPQARSGTLKICQGVPIPDGYVIVAYRTLTACPHGAYVIKRQDEPQQVNTPKRDTPASASPLSVASRPRRVSLTQPTAEVPSLHGTGSVSEPRQATTARATPNGTTVNAGANAVPERDWEEVGEGEVVRIDTTLVTVPVSVLDRQGRFVPNLRREDFSVFENGIEQSIAYFEPTEKPFTVALLLDTSASTRFHLSDIKEAAMAFAMQLRPQDRVLVVTFNDEVLLLTEVTNDANLISAVIQQNAQTGNSTRLYDAVDLVFKERLNKIPGRKAVVLFTDGVDTASYLATYQTTLYQAEELDALIYPIQYDTSDYMRAMQGGGTITIVTSNSSWPFPGSRSSQVIHSIPSSGVPPPGSTKADYDRADQYLRALADKTGARLYRANNPAELAHAFAQVAEELRRQYSLGYYPQPPAVQSGEQRQIRVRVRQPNLAVKARNSYLRRSAKTPAP
ncbi:MAG: VWA domain-containing protein, partial [Pyrinomonadaceae bacterium]